MNESLLKAIFKLYRLNQRLILGLAGLLCVLLIVIIAGFSISKVQTNKLDSNTTELTTDINESESIEKIATSGATTSISNEKIASSSPSLLPTPQPTPRPTLLPASAAATPWLTSATATPTTKPTPTPSAKTAISTESAVKNVLPSPTLKPSIAQVATPSVKPVVKEDKVATQTLENTGTYTVQKGDTLFKIAEKELGQGTRYTELALLNKLKSADHIEIGQVLRLGDQQNVENKQSNTQVITKDSEGKIASGVTTGKTYTVQKGDSLWAISQTQLANPYSWTELYKANKAVIGSNPNLIYPGTVLQIPSNR